MAGKSVTIAVTCALLSAGAAAFAQVGSPQQARPQLQTGQAATGRPLTDRNTGDPNSDTEVDATVVGEMRMPVEASGRYDLGHGADVMQIDFTPDGTEGYLSLFGSRATGDAKAPLTFFFMQTRVDGDRLHFVTHEIHRTWYEFDGVLTQSPPQEKTLLVDYALVGTLTTHRRDDKGVEQTRIKKVRFKRMRWWR
jgi:hypothetical protein